VGLAARAQLVFEGVLEGQPQTWRACAAAVLAGGALQGAALGSASGTWQISVYSAVKVPLLLLAATAVTLPSFYVLHAVLGLRDDFAAACRGLLSTQAALGVALGSTAPLVVFLIVTVPDPYLQTLGAGAAFAAATLSSQSVLRRHYAPLLARDRRHRVTLTCWAVLYVFFSIQLAWVLRPFLGTPGLPIEFLRAQAFEQNAYVVLYQHVARLWR